MKSIFSHMLCLVTQLLLDKIWFVKDKGREAYELSLCERSSELY